MANGHPFAQRRYFYNFSRGCEGVGTLSGHILLQLWLVRIYILISFESLVNIVLILLQDLSLSYLARVRLRLLRQQQEKERDVFFVVF